jgi:LmbE family N-acetylglucosaminyl deacetylase
MGGLLEECLSGGRFPYRDRSLLLAAHPDDEVLAAGALLSGLSACTVVHLTDGAPHDRHLSPARGELSRAQYAEVRHEETLRALAHVGIGPDRVLSLGAIDQDSPYDLVALTWRLTTLLDEIRPTFVLTHAYEGGHPDHDAAAFVARSAIDLVRGGPMLLEMASYHARGGVFTPFAFLESTRPVEEAVFFLSTAERARKREMLACFETQRAIVSRFPIELERFRLAPRHDFQIPPHEGLLYYETLGWQMTGARWRELAAHAMRELRVSMPWRGPVSY